MSRIKKVVRPKCPKCGREMIREKGVVLFNYFCYVCGIWKTDSN